MRTIDNRMSNFIILCSTYTFVCVYFQWMKRNVFGEPLLSYFLVY